MNNKIFNHYGALRRDTPESEDLVKLSSDIDALVNDYFNKFPNLTPIEVRCVDAYLNTSITCCEHVLRKAIGLRKSEKLVDSNK